MAKYIKKFNAHTDYNTFTQSEDFIKPNVSHCIQEQEMHYNPIPDPRLIAIFVNDDGYERGIYNYKDFLGISGAALFDKIEIDGVEVPISTLDAANGQYYFTSGKHTVAYTLKDQTTIPDSAFDDTSFDEMKIPGTVTTIGSGSLRCCGNSPIINIPDSVTTIGDDAFCSDNLDEATLAKVTNINPNGASVCRCWA